MKKILLLIIITPFIFPPSAHAITTNDLFTVSSKTYSASVGDTIDLKFEFTSVSLTCGAFRVKLVTTNKAFTNTSFVGGESPVSDFRNSNEVHWNNLEAHDGKTIVLTPKVKISKGTIGEIIKNFKVVTSGCPNDPKGWNYLNDQDGPRIKIVKKSTSVSNSSANSKTSKLSSNLASISDLNSIFRSVHGRNPNGIEWKYWASRLLDKGNRTALKGAIAYHKALGLTTGGPITKKTNATTSKTIKSTPNLASISDLNSIFRSVHGRNPSISEWQYWADRLLDKSNRIAFKDAIKFHKLNNIIH